MNKKSRILFIITSICIAIGITCYLVFFIMKLANVNGNIASSVLGFGSLFETIAFILIIIRAIVFGFPSVELEDEPYEEEIKIVDVKPVKETQEEKLYKEYEALYKEGLITKEDLDIKKKELLK